MNGLDVLVGVFFFFPLKSSKPLTGKEYFHCLESGLVVSIRNKKQDARWHTQTERMGQEREEREGEW